MVVQIQNAGNQGRICLACVACLGAPCEIAAKEHSHLYPFI